MEDLGFITWILEGISIWPIASSIKLLFIWSLARLKNRQHDASKMMSTFLFGKHGPILPLSLQIHITFPNSTSKTQPSILSKFLSSFKGAQVPGHGSNYSVSIYWTRKEAWKEKQEEKDAHRETSQRVFRDALRSLWPFWSKIGPHTSLCHTTSCHLPT